MRFTAVFATVGLVLLSGTASANPNRILVVPLQSQSSAVDEYGHGLAAELASELATEKRHVVPLSELPTLFEKASLDLSNLADSKTALALGKQAHATLTIFGTVDVHGNKLRVQLSMLRVAGGSVRSIGILDGPIADPFAFAHKLSTQVAKALDRGTTATRAQQPAPFKRRRQAFELASKSLARWLEGDYDKAERFAGEALRLGGDYSITNLAMAVVKVFKLEAAAVRYANKAVSLNPQGFAERIVLSLAKSHVLSDPAGALKEMNVALRLSPGQRDALVQRGLLRLRTRDQNGALADAASILKSTPNDSDALALRGTAMMTQDKNAAKRDLSRALAVDPNNWMAMQALGGLAMMDMDVDRAIRLYTRELKTMLRVAPYMSGMEFVLHELLGGAYQTRAAVNAHAGKPWKSDLRRALREFGRSYDVHASIHGRQLLMFVPFLKWRTEYIAVVREVAAEAPVSPSLQAWEANLTYQLEAKPKLAKRKMRAILERHADARLALEIYVGLLGMEAQRGDRESAREATSLSARMVALEPGNPRVVGSHLGVLLVAGNLREAERFGADAVRRFPHDADIVQNYGTVLSQAGKPALAAAQYRRAIKLNPKLHMPYINLGSIMMKETESKQGTDRVKALNAACDMINEGVKRGPGEPFGMLNLGACRIAQGRTTEGIELWRRFLKVAPQHPMASKLRAMLAELEK